MRRAWTCLAYLRRFIGQFPNLETFYMLLGEMILVDSAAHSGADSDWASTATTRRRSEPEKKANITGPSGIASDADGESNRLDINPTSSEAATTSTTAAAPDEEIIDLASRPGYDERNTHRYEVVSRSVRRYLHRHDLFQGNQRTYFRAVKCHPNACEDTMGERTAPFYDKAYQKDERAAIGFQLLYWMDIDAVEEALAFVGTHDGARHARLASRRGRQGWLEGRWKVDVKETLEAQDMSEPDPDPEDFDDDDDFGVMQVGNDDYHNEGYDAGEDVREGAVEEQAGGSHDDREEGEGLQEEIVLGNDNAPGRTDTYAFDDDWWLSDTSDNAYL